MRLYISVDSNQLGIACRWLEWKQRTTNIDKDIDARAALTAMLVDELEGFVLRMEMELQEKGIEDAETLDAAVRRFHGIKEKKHA